ncbi:MAG: hypothetical protein ABJO28_16230 [Maribacter dokdonensis]|uniref:immunoglobulin domain-containing protein n=1 Tax=Maribacter dokdonensis TaxID=320912 RepID=UPI003299886F
MKWIKVIIFIFCLVSVFKSQSQVTGDYRSVSSGVWNVASNWQYFNGVTWVSATSYPGENSNVGSVTIANGRIITLNVDIDIYTIEKLLIGDESGTDDTLSLPNNGDFYVNIKLIAVQSDGILTWVKNADLNLPSDAIIYNNGGEITTDKNCNASQNIFIGNEKFSNCNGNGGSDYSFEEIEGALPPPSSDGDITECEESPRQTLTASATPPNGAYVGWYTTSSGGSPVSPTFNAIGNVTYYAESVDNSDSSRRSLFRTAVELTMVSKPSISITESPSCNFGFFTATTYSLEVTVSSGSVVSTAGNVSNTSGNIWSISDVPDQNDIIITVSDANGCINELPITAPNCFCPTVDAPVSNGDVSYCTGEPIPNISVSVSSGETVDWYGSSNGGTALLFDNSTFSPSESGTYYAEARNSTTNCVSGARTAVEVNEDSPSTAAIGPDQTIFTGGNAIFTSTLTNADIFQWQVSQDNGVTFNDITNGQEYSGGLTPTLTVHEASSVKNGFKYRILVSNSSSVCPSVVSSSALLIVRVKKLVTNRNITYRIKLL